jgi:hypothetical protein
MAITTVWACGGASSARPAGAPAVESVPMTRRVPGAVARACREAARLTSVPVVCPRVLPKVRVDTDSRVTGAFVRGGRDDLYEVTVNSGLRMHWIAGAGADAAVDRFIVDGEENEVRGAARSAGAVEVDGRRFALVRFGGRAGGPHSGHVIALWRHDGRTSFVSVHGREHEDVAVAMLDDVARQTQAAR